MKKCNVCNKTKPTVFFKSKKKTYLCGAILSLPQVWLAKQWNLVLINFNLLIGYGIFLFG